MSLLRHLQELYLYNISTQEKKLVKEKTIPSGHNPDDYIVERVNAKSRDNKDIPLTITYHKIHFKW